MNISYNWLTQYISMDLEPDQAAEKLTLLGLEVESVTRTGAEFDGFVVGEVREVREHPDADRLSVCRVDLGQNKTVQIVCGAPNVATGQKVPVATVGSTMPLPMDDGSRLTIRPVKLRGEKSSGMICSESELGLGDNRDGIMVLDGNFPAGSPLSEALGIETDTIFEIGLTPNRPDAASHAGVARDLAAVLGKSICTPYDEWKKPGRHHEPAELADLLDVEIRNPEACGRYAAKMVRGITVGESPRWLQNRLLAIGLRPINNVVDATNYILHEIGQPLHAFDYKLIHGNRIEVQSCEREQKFRTLDNQQRTIPAGSLFICDGEGPVALAGIMGGADSEVSDQTEQIVIESAWFEPSSIRRTARLLGMQTDSSYRFERGVDPNLAGAACERAARLIAELTGGEVVEGTIDRYPEPVEPVSLKLRMNRLNSLLGTDLDADNAAGMLKALEFEITDQSRESLTCKVPTFRPDVTREVDLIEEVGRLFDYNNIPQPETTPFFQPSPLDRWETFHNRVRTLATRLMYREISSNSLLSRKEADRFTPQEEQIQTLNPVSSEATTLRSTLLAGFLKVTQFNLNRKAENLRLFEVGHTYRRSEEGTWIEGIEEHSRLLLGLCGLKRSENWREEAQPWSLFDLKADLESLLRQLGVRHMNTKADEENRRLDYLLDGTVVATLMHVPESVLKTYEVERDVVAAEVNLTRLFRTGHTGRDEAYRPVPRFPGIEYDVAYVVDREVTAAELTRPIRETVGEILEDLRVFDVYEGGNLGEGKKSIAIRLTFLDRTKTLNINDVEPVVQKITQVLSSKTGAKLRS